MTTLLPCWPEQLEYLDGLQSSRPFVNRLQFRVHELVEVSYSVIIKTLQILLV